MNPTSTRSPLVRLLAVIGLILCGALLLGAPQAAADPQTSVEPLVLATEPAGPTARAEQPGEPARPWGPGGPDDLVIDPCDLHECPPPCPAEQECPPPVDPCVVDPTLCEPPTEPEPEPEPKPEPKKDIPTPTRIDAGGGSTAADVPLTPLTAASLGLVLTGIALGGWLLLRPQGSRR